MLKVFAFLTKREDIETQAFIEHYEGSHVPLICSCLLYTSRCV